MSRQAIIGILSLMIFVVLFIFYGICRVIPASDSWWTIPIARSIIDEKNIDVDEFVHIKAYDKHLALLIKNDGHYYGYFPIGSSVLAVPFVWYAKTIGYDLSSPHKFLTFEKIIASFYSALTATIIFIALFLYTKKILVALILDSIFALCTPILSICSRAMWSHTGSVFLISISLLLLMIARNGRERVVSYIAIPVALSYIVRPTNVVFVILFTLYILLFWKKQFIGYVLWGSVLGLGFIIFSMANYNALLPPYYFPSRLAGTHTFWEAFVGNLISPSRGIFVFSPVLLFAFYAIYDMIKKGISAIYIMFIIIIVVHLFIISFFPHWWGGWCYGPRLFSDTLPYFIFLMVPAIGEIIKLRKGYIILFAVICLFSVLVHFHGAISYAASHWNTVPTNIDKHPQRLWDWAKPQYLFL